MPRLVLPIDEESIQAMLHVTKLSTCTRIHQLQDFPGFPTNIRACWIAYPHDAQVTAIGLLLSRRRFVQLALADKTGRVYFGNTITPHDFSSHVPDISFIEASSYVRMKDDRRFYGTTLSTCRQVISRDMKLAYYQWRIVHHLKYLSSVQSMLASLSKHEAESKKSSEHNQSLDDMDMIELYEYMFDDAHDHSNESANPLTRMKCALERTRKQLRQACTHKRHEAMFVAAQDSIVVQDRLTANQDDDYDMRTVASLLHIETLTGSRYTLEHLRTPLPDTLRCNLQYRDAISVAFFASFFAPDLLQAMSGFGSQQIFRRLRREAPLGAIRRSIEDMHKAQQAGLRISGLEQYFERLMQQVDVLSHMGELEAVHGAERLHMYESPLSSTRSLIWDNGLEPASALKVLRLESALNRFYNIAECVEVLSKRYGSPCEETISQQQVAQIDNLLLEDPAYRVYPMYYDRQLPNIFHPDVHRASLQQLFEFAQGHAQYRAFGECIDILDDNKTHCNQSNPSEWMFRQSLSQLIRQMRLPFRFDADFRSNLQDGHVAIVYTAASKSMMPTQRFDKESGTWNTLSQREQHASARRYNFRLGMMFAAIAFGLSDAVQQVALRLDSVGLEETVRAQASVMTTLLNRAIQTLDAMSNAESSSKGDPKDGDVHGDPTKRADTPLLSIVDDSAANDEKSVHTEREEDDDNPLSIFTQAPANRTLMTVRIKRCDFLQALTNDAWQDPEAFYRQCHAQFSVDDHGALQEIEEPALDLHDAIFAPRAAQEEPEFGDYQLADTQEQPNAFGATSCRDLAIQREDVLQQAVADFHRIAADEHYSTAQKAREVIALVNHLHDPELVQVSQSVTSAIINGDDLPALSFTVSKEIEQLRWHIRNMLIAGQPMKAIEAYAHALRKYDAMFTIEGTVARYFNSYAERVLYNRNFTTSNEYTLLIPDGLFYAHMELADLLAQTHQHDEAIKQLNQMVAYAPTYPLFHIRLALELAQREDWVSVRAACLNALNVCLDRDDAAFAYYRLAYAQWMSDEFDAAVASYRMADELMPEPIDALHVELHELIARAQSQCISVPMNLQEAQEVLQAYNIPLWPHIPAQTIMQEAARQSVDSGAFVVARTLSVAAARMSLTNPANDIIQAQFIRSLNA